MDALPLRVACTDTWRRRRRIGGVFDLSCANASPALLLAARFCCCCCCRRRRRALVLPARLLLRPAGAHAMRSAGGLAAMQGR